MENLVNTDWSWSWSGPRFVIDSDFTGPDHTLVDTSDGFYCNGLIDIHVENASVELLNLIAHYYNTPEIAELFDRFNSWTYPDPADSVSPAAENLAENLLVSLFETVEHNSRHQLTYPQYYTDPIF